MNWPLSVPPNSPANRRRISAINSERERWPSSRNAEVAATEQTSEPYVGRVLRMTLLAPDIVEAIVSWRQPAEMTLAGLMRPFPVRWREQVAMWEAFSRIDGLDRARHLAARQNFTVL